MFSLTNSETLMNWSITSGINFGVTSDGKLFAKEANISGNINIIDGSININNGNFIVIQNGDVNIKSGSINLGGTELTPVFSVDNEGSVIANNIKITGGSLTIGGTLFSPNFSIDNDGSVVAKSISIVGGEISIGGEYSDPVFHVDSDGSVTASDLLITGGSINLGTKIDDYYPFQVNNFGELRATSGIISGFSINDTQIIKGNIGDTSNSVMISTGTNAIIEGLDHTGTNHSWVFTSNNQFGVDSNGYVYAGNLYVNSISVIQGSISVSSLETNILQANDYLNINNIILQRGTSGSEINYMLYFELSENHYIENDNIIIDWTINSYANMSHTNEQIVPTTTVIYASLKYRKSINDILDTTVYTSTIEINIVQNTNTNTGTYTMNKTIINGVTTKYMFVSFTIITAQREYVEGVILDILTINNNFGPVTSNLYSCGAPNNKWSEIYASTGEINTSDRNSKLDIDYNISSYDIMFDKLKPAKFDYSKLSAGVLYFLK